MAIQLPNFIKRIFERTVSGDNWYYINNDGEWADGVSNLTVSQNHPILTPALLFVSKLFSQAEFTIKNTKTGKYVDKHWLLDLLNNPNFYQTREDFLESLLFNMIADGRTVVRVKKSTTLQTPNSLYILRNDLIEFPEEYKSKMFNYSNSELKKLKIIYDKDGVNESINIQDLFFFYDLPNCLSDNFYDSKSRLDGLKQTLINTKDSLKAKNIIIKSNGKELLSGKKDSFPLTDEEKNKAEIIFADKYGLSESRKRALITKGEIHWQSMHIALRDLGLDESVKIDGNLIYTALHIPKDILSLEAKKTTYNNFKESMVSYIQNEMQPTIDSVCSVLQRFLINESNLKIEANYDHLPIMQFILIERYDGVTKRAKALQELLKAGIPDEIALDLCGFDKTIKLKKPEKNETTSTTSESTQQGAAENNQE